MIRYLKKEQGSIVELASAERGCWVHIVGPISLDEQRKLADSFEVEMDYFTDALDIDERSRYEREEEARFILINTAVFNDTDNETDPIFITIPIGIILTEHHVITISARETPVVELFLKNRVKYFDPANQSKFVLQILEQNVYRFLACLKQLNVKRNLIEKELLDSSRNRELMQLLSIEKSLVYFVNSLSVNELLNLKMNRTDFLHLRGNEYLTDLFEDIIIDSSQALEMANIHTNILNGTMDAYGSIISNNLNIVMKRLTLITIILMVPTLVASFYGMNINLPLAKSNFAFIYIFFGSMVFSLLLAWYFQRKKLF